MTEMSARGAFGEGSVKGVKGLSVTAPHARRDNQETLHNPSPLHLDERVAATIAAAHARRQRRAADRAAFAASRTAGKATYHRRRLAAGSTTTTNRTENTMTTTYEARREADRAHRASLPPIDPKTIKFTIGREKPETCARCERHDTLGVMLGIAAGDTHLCGPCVELAAGKDGEAMVMLIEGLEDVDSALFWATDQTRPTLAAIASNLFAQMLVTRFGMPALMELAAAVRQIAQVNGIDPL